MADVFPEGTKRPTYIVDRIVGNNVVVKDAFSIGDEASVMLPLDKVQLYQKVHETEAPGEKHMVDLMEEGSQVPDINRIADYRKPEDEVSQAKREEEDQGLRGGRTQAEFSASRFIDDNFRDAMGLSDFGRSWFNDSTYETPEVGQRRRIGDYPKLTHLGKYTSRFYYKGRDFTDWLGEGDSYGKMTPDIVDSYGAETAFNNLGLAMLEGKSFKAAREEVREMFEGQEFPAMYEGYAEEAVAALDKFDPRDFGVETEPGDINNLAFAVREAVKDNNVFNKNDQKEVAEIVVNDFPALARWFGRKPNDAPTPAVDPDPTVEQRMTDAKGMKQDSGFKKALDAVVKAYHSFRRTYHEIDPNESPELARVNDSFRRLTIVPHLAKAKAQNTVAQITEGLGPNNYKTFERIVQLRDMQRRAEAGIDPDFGLADLTQINDSLTHFEKEAAKYPEIQKALTLREQLTGDVRDTLVNLSLLPASVRNEPRYYHRQVHKAIDSVYGSTGSQDVRLHKKGFQRQLEGNKGDYNTNYLESEAEWLSQAYAQLAKYDLQQEIEATINKAPTLKAEAKLRGVKDWKSLIDKKKDVLWQPKEGNYLMRVETILDQTLTPAVMSSLPTGVKDMLIQGQRRPEWVVPKDVAKLLDKFQPDQPEEAVRKVTAQLTGMMKQWMLINPKNFANYNLRNAVSDLDVVLARYPQVLGDVYGAYKKLRAYSKSPSSPEAQSVLEAIQDGVIDSGQTFAEIPDINKLSAFKAIAPNTGNPLKMPVDKLMGAWDGLKSFTNFRENLLRLAAYEYLKRQVNAGVPTYGASEKGQVDAITDPRLKAAKVAREFMGDYGGISEAGRIMRKHLIPFYSWLEINAPRYVRMIKNIPHEGTPFKMGPALVGKGLKVAANTPRLVAQATALTGAFILWNNYGPFSQEEEKLKRTDVGRQPHVIVGIREDGTPMVLRLETALTDALGWLDLGEGDADVVDVTTGRATVADKLADAVKAPVNHLVNALSPVYKVPAEVSLGRSTFPTLFEKGASFKVEPKSIRDGWEYAARAFSVDYLYKKITGRPSPSSGGIVSDTLDATITARIDSDEAVYWSVRADASNYAEKLGKVSAGGDPTEKSNALFFYRQALKWGDEAAARRYLDKYRSLAGDEKSFEEGLKRSMDKAHPLGALDNELWGPYIRTLNQDRRNQLYLALKFYRENYDQKDSVGEETGATVQDLYKTLFPKPVRTVSENNTTIPMAVDIYENAGLSDADLKRVKNAILLRAVEKIKGKSLTAEDQSAIKRIGINLVTDADVQLLHNAGELKKKAQTLKRAAKFGY